MYVLAYICNDLWWTHIKTCSKQWNIKNVKEDGNIVLANFTKKTLFFEMLAAELLKWYDFKAYDKNNWVIFYINI